MDQQTENQRSEHATVFRDLHVPGKPFVLANAWDIGSARMLESLGARAIGSSSAALAFTLGKKDLGHLSRTESLAHAAGLAASLAVPVSADLENGYADDPDGVARTIELAIGSGVAGASIEDIAAPSEDPYPLDRAVDRIAAAVEAIRRSGQEFILTARADGVLYGKYTVSEAIERIRAFEKSGADVLYVPMPGDLDDLTRICASVSIPVNALAAGPFLGLSMDDFARAGVARVSLGSSLARVTHRAIHDCAKEFFTTGHFSKMQNTISGDRVEQMIGQVTGKN